MSNQTGSPDATEATAGSGSPDISDPHDAAKHAAVSAKQVAMIGAIAGLLSAAIAIPTTLIAAERASDTAIKTTSQQLSGETERSRAEFLRGQRQKAYTQILVDHAALVKVEETSEFQYYLGAPRPREYPRIRATNHRLIEGLRKLAYDEVTIQVIGSPDAGRAVQDLFQAHGGVNYALTAYAGTVERGGNVDRVEGRLRKASDKAYEAAQHFIRVIRVDLGVD